ncbi:hypothetical protein ACQ86N_42990 [Puia sp. P3]|uniref:hypothetical protein n=1 Tax=Puia sp. P3 TaxID=3423952 RepID=UPI003D66A44D
MLSSDYLFYNSLHLWKSQWAIGKWMQDIYKGEPSVNLSVYESGYGLQDSFRIGAGASGATTLKVNLVRNISGPPDTMPLIRYIQEQRSTHIHALLSGKEGEQFLQLYQEHIGPSGAGISVNPFMVEDDFDVYTGSRSRPLQCQYLDPHPEHTRQQYLYPRIQGRLG